MHLNIELNLSIQENASFPNDDDWFHYIFRKHRQYIHLVNCLDDSETFNYEEEPVGQFRKNTLITMNLFLI